MFEKTCDGRHSPTHTPRRMRGRAMREDDSSMGTTVITDDVAGLAAIDDALVELAVWRRELPKKLSAWLDALRPASLPDLRVLVRLDDLKTALSHEWRTPPGSASTARDLLINDITQLAMSFARLSRQPYDDPIDVRLETIQTNSCWKFHRDHVRLRLLTSYRGRGVQWIDPSLSERALVEQNRFDGPIQELPRHHVAVLRGSASCDGNGLVHRSPPIAGTGETRLVLCLNQPCKTSPPIWSAVESPSVRR